MQLARSSDYSLMTTPIQTLMRPALMVEPQTSIHETAQRMTTAHSNTALVVEQGQLLGIVTDQNFRVRVIAAGLSPHEAIHSIMSKQPITLAPNALASEAMLLMAAHNIRHIPLIDAKQNIVGVVGGTDLLRSQSHNAVYLIGDIHLAKTVSDLQQLSEHIAPAFNSLVKSQLPAYYLTQIMSSITQAINQKLLQLGEQQFGEPPIDYAFIVAGSLARQEQTAYTDQDNGMILSDDYNEMLHGDYFKQLANFVSDGLNACGYDYCSGDIMATNSKWRQPLSVWKGYFKNWIQVPEPQALLYASIFFDLRCIYGSKQLFQNLHEQILVWTQKSSLFLMHMANNAQTFKPPLGFFKGLVLETNILGQKGVDIKKYGIAPITDIARVYALASGLNEVNTTDRLKVTAETGMIAAAHSTNLQQALEVINALRVEHQAKQMEQNLSPDNFIQTTFLSELDQRHLKSAFELVKLAQEALIQQFKAEHLR